jgi:hypothetical protein
MGKLEIGDVIFGLDESLKVDEAASVEPVEC